MEKYESVFVTSHGVLNLRNNTVVLDFLFKDSQQLVEMQLYILRNGIIYQGFITIYSSGWSSDTNQKNGEKKKQKLKKNIRGDLIVCSLFLPPAGYSYLQFWPIVSFSHFILSWSKGSNKENWHEWKLRAEYASRFVYKFYIFIF